MMLGWMLFWKRLEELIGKEATGCVKNIFVEGIHIMNIDKTTFQVPSSNFTKGRPGMIQGITLHSTEGAFPGCGHWLCDPNAGASAHYIVARDGSIYQLVGDADTAWHAGHAWGNNHTVGIEVEHVRGQDYPEIQVAALRELCLQLIDAYNIPASGIVAHRWLTPERRNDPTDWPDAALKTWIASLYAEKPALTPRSVPILGNEPVLKESIIAKFIRNGSWYKQDALQYIVSAYQVICALSGVSPRVALAQMALETGWLTSEWCRPPHHNPAGIGTGDGNGVSFPTWHDGIVAHVGRLLAYAAPDEGKDALQYGIAARALSWRPLPDQYHGCASEVDDLGGTWAADTEYGFKLRRIINEL